MDGRERDRFRVAAAMARQGSEHPVFYGYVWPILRPAVLPLAAVGGVVILVRTTGIGLPEGRTLILIPLAILGIGGVLLILWGSRGRIARSGIGPRGGGSGDRRIAPAAPSRFYGGSQAGERFEPDPDDEVWIDPGDLDDEAGDRTVIPVLFPAKKRAGGRR